MIQQPFFNLSQQVVTLADKAEELCKERFAQIDEIAAYNQAKVLRAFMDQHISESHFAPTTGYGYNDRGRDDFDKVVAQVFGAEDALIRHNFVSGTNTITTALFGVLRPGDLMVSALGKPYDTLDEVIGIRGEGMGSLKDFGVKYQQVELLEDGTPDMDAIAAAAKDAKMIYIQRSRGYSLRPSVTVDTIAQIASRVKAVNPNVLVVVDNCYGEFVEKLEPTQVGADLMMGSLIKNPGGGIAPTGGYIAGRADLIELCSYRLTNPGTGREVGCTLGHTREMMMGFFAAPQTVKGAVKTATFATALYELMGYDVYPKYHEYRSDIICTLVLRTPEGVSRFCRGIQKGSPIDSFVTPEAWDMPGYEDPVIMAAGAFIMGASIELSADAPMKDPYAVWMQGGLNYDSGKIGVLLAAQEMLHG